MSNKITRRDLLNGMAFALAGAALGPKTVLANSIAKANDTLSGHQQFHRGYYPPVKNGIRGSHKGSYEVAHELAWNGNKPERYEELDEEYDLIVVGAGISGLSAASFYQKHTGGNKKILLLDNHDDFGGHAKRNEFHSQGKMYLGYGGSQNIEYPDNYGAIAREFLEELGIDFEKLEKAMDPTFPMAKMNQPLGMFLETKNSAKTVNGDWVRAGLGLGDHVNLVKQLDLTEVEKQRLIDFYKGEKDYLGDLSLSEKLTYIKTTAYNDFLKDKVGLTNDALSLFNTFLCMSYSVGGDCTSVAEALLRGAPGLKALGWLGRTAVDLAVDPDDMYTASYFPDGNASIARMIVRELIPEVAPGNSMFDIVTDKFDYQKLDQPRNLVNLRLNSTVVKAENNPDNTVSVSYVDSTHPTKRNLRVKAKHCILACYNGHIPHNCPEVPEKQKQNLKYGVKAPFVYVNVLLRDGAVVNKAGVNMNLCPNSLFELVHIAPLTTLGDYKPKLADKEPALLFMHHSPSPLRDPNNPNQTARDLYRLGRYKLYSTPFSEYEANIKKQLTAMYGQYGFDAERDIEAITVNRWSHGYAYDYMDLFDPEWPEGEAPHELGRKPIGNITIANTDSEAYAYVNGAINAAWRAVKEQLLD
mgnify:CR=1 FL=1